jgi:DNA-binding NtrC family response regulator
MTKARPKNRNRTRYLAVYLQKRHGQRRGREDASPDAILPSLEELERDYMNYVLEITNNDPAATAEILDVPPAHLFRRMKRIEVWI